MKKLLTLLMVAALALGYVYATTPDRNKGGGSSTTTKPTLKWDASTHTLTYGDYSYKMVYVPGGSFTMGATGQLATYSYSDEKPTHRVTLSSYYIGECEVPQWLWTVVMGRNPSKWKGNTLPVESVSWDLCVAFIGQLNYLTDASFRLPTEAQWEFAAREGKDNNDNLYSGGNDMYELASVAWYGTNSYSQPHPVKKKRPNALGLYDMTGNVSEWCQDWYGHYSSAAQTDPTGPSSGSGHCKRGGWWGTAPCGCRVSCRGWGTSNSTSYSTGLRLALPQN